MQSARAMVWQYQSLDIGIHVCLPMNHWSYLDGRLVPKISKRHFFRDIQNSFHEVTHIGLEPHQIFSFWNISTNMVARGVQSFGRNGPWWAGYLKYGQNFLVNFAQTCDEQMLKISRRYLDSCQSYSWISKNLLQPMAP